MYTLYFKGTFDSALLVRLTSWSPYVGRYLYYKSYSVHALRCQVKLNSEEIWRPASGLTLITYIFYAE